MHGVRGIGTMVVLTTMCLGFPVHKVAKRDNVLLTGTSDVEDGFKNIENEQEKQEMLEARAISNELNRFADQENSNLQRIYDKPEDPEVSSNLQSQEMNGIQKILQDRILIENTDQFVTEQTLNVPLTSDLLEETFDIFNDQGVSNELDVTTSQDLYNTPVTRSGAEKSIVPNVQLQNISRLHGFIVQDAFNGLGLTDVEEKSFIEDMVNRPEVDDLDQKSGIIKQDVLEDKLNSLKNDDSEKLSTLQPEQSNVWMTSIKPFSSKNKVNLKRKTTMKTSNKHEQPNLPEKFNQIKKVNPNLYDTSNLHDATEKLDDQLEQDQSGTARIANGYSDNVEFNKTESDYITVRKNKQNIAETADEKMSELKNQQVLYDTKEALTYDKEDALDSPKDSDFNVQDTAQNQDGNGESDIYDLQVVSEETTNSEERSNMNVQDAAQDQDGNAEADNSDGQVIPEETINSEERSNMNVQDSAQDQDGNKEANFSDGQVVVDEKSSINDQNFSQGQDSNADADYSDGQVVPEDITNFDERSNMNAPDSAQDQDGNTGDNFSDWQVVDEERSNTNDQDLAQDQDSNVDADYFDGQVVPEEITNLEERSNINYQDSVQDQDGIAEADYSDSHLEPKEVINLGERSSINVQELDQDQNGNEEADFSDGEVVPEETTNLEERSSINVQDSGQDQDGNAEADFSDGKVVLEETSNLEERSNINAQNSDQNQEDNGEADSSDVPEETTNLEERSNINVQELDQDQNGNEAADFSDGEVVPEETTNLEEGSNINTQNSGQNQEDNGEADSSDVPEETTNLEERSNINVQELDQDQNDNEAADFSDGEVVPEETTNLEERSNINAQNSGQNQEDNGEADSSDVPEETTNLEERSSINVQDLAQDQEGISDGKVVLEETSNLKERSNTNVQKSNQDKNGNEKADFFYSEVVTEETTNLEDEGDKHVHNPTQVQVVNADYDFSDGSGVPEETTEVEEGSNISVHDLGVDQDGLGKTSFVVVQLVREETSNLKEENSTDLHSTANVEDDNNLDVLVVVPKESSNLEERKNLNIQLTAQEQHVNNDSDFSDDKVVPGTLTNFEEIGKIYFPGMEKDHGIETSAIDEYQEEIRNINNQDTDKQDSDSTDTYNQYKEEKLEGLQLGEKSKTGIQGTNNEQIEESSDPDGTDESDVGKNIDHHESSTTVNEFIEKKKISEGPVLNSNNTNMNGQQDPELIKEEIKSSIGSEMNSEKEKSNQDVLNLLNVGNISKKENLSENINRPVAETNDLNENPSTNYKNIQTVQDSSTQNKSLFTDYDKVLNLFETIEFIDSEERLKEQASPDRPEKLVEIEGANNSSVLKLNMTNETQDFIERINISTLQSSKVNNTDIETDTNTETSNDLDSEKITESDDTLNLKSEEKSNSTIRDVQTSSIPQTNLTQNSSNIGSNYASKNISNPRDTNNIDILNLPIASGTQEISTTKEALDKGNFIVNINISDETIDTNDSERFKQDSIKSIASPLGIENISDYKSSKNDISETQETTNVKDVALHSLPDIPDNIISEESINLDIGSFKTPKRPITQEHYVQNPSNIPTNQYYIPNLQKPQSSLDYQHYVTSNQRTQPPLAIPDSQYYISNPQQSPPSLDISTNQYYISNLQKPSLDNQDYLINPQAIRQPSNIPENQYYIPNSEQRLPVYYLTPSGPSVRLNFPVTRDEEKLPQDIYNTEYLRTNLRQIPSIKIMPPIMIGASSEDQEKINSQGLSLYAKQIRRFIEDAVSTVSKQQRKHTGSKNKESSVYVSESKNFTQILNRILKLSGVVKPYKMEDILRGFNAYGTSSPTWQSRQDQTNVLASLGPIWGPVVGEFLNPIITLFMNSMTDQVMAALFNGLDVDEPILLKQEENPNVADTSVAGNDEDKSEETKTDTEYLEETTENEYYEFITDKIESFENSEDEIEITKSH